MAETDWTSLFQTGLSVAGAVYQGQLEKKAQRAAAKYGASDFAQLGMGLAATGPQRGGLLDLYTAAMGGVQGGGSSTAPSGMQRSGPMYAIGNNGRVYGLRSMGTPLLWSGDLAAVKRVARVARKLGRFVHHRRPR